MGEGGRGSGGRRGASPPGGGCLLQGEGHWGRLPTSVQDASRRPHVAVSVWIQEELTKLKTRSLSHTVHISSAQRPHRGSGWRPGQHRKRPFPLPQKLFGQSWGDR